MWCIICYIDDLLQQVYPHISVASATPELFAKRAILTPRNEDVDTINSRLIEAFCGVVHCTSMIRSIDISINKQDIEKFADQGATFDCKSTTFRKKIFDYERYCLFLDLAR